MERVAPAAISGKVCLYGKCVCRFGPMPFYSHDLSLRWVLVFWPPSPTQEYKGRGHGFQVILFSQWGWRWAREGNGAFSSLGSCGAQWTGPHLGVRGWGLTLLPLSSTSCVFLGKPSASPPQTEVMLQAALVRHSHTVKPEPDHGCENVQSAWQGYLPVGQGHMGPGSSHL